ncbi:STM4014 family protein [Massilia sp. G4R7]|uniref:STM4014 family protein n=1 Tax=Massilia phyllostachyos TaxID=2898585 RepID=A0ABS8QBQ5_9BURK|nr:STM4014 family protein [Massilia phyllostachyos]MCD2519177.1 STM4014 family protein [Massilia phyllostachyos]
MTAGAVLPFVLLGVGAGKRVRLMHAARAALGLAPAQVIEWRDWLARPALLDAAVARPCVLKIESPGDDATLHHALLTNGCAALGLPAPRAPEHGELSLSAAWFKGFTRAMEAVAALLARQPHVRVLNAPHELLLMTDKLRCQQHLQAHGVPVARLFGLVEGYDHLRALLDEHRLDRVFIKARYGSSASGVIAYRRNGRGAEQTTSSAHLAGSVVYNVKRLRRYDRHADIVQLVDLLAAQEAYLEGWLPKPRHGMAHYDVRVLTIGGQAAHRVARVGASMMTNLHLDNRRADVDALLDSADRAALTATAHGAAAAFPASHVIGLDIVARQGKAHVLEANAFGDLLPGLLHDGLDSYAGQLQSFVRHEA